MKALTFLSIILLSIQCFADDTPGAVKVYCFSDALEAGFKDVDGGFFCNRLTKIVGKKKGSIVPAGRESADVVIHYLGNEQLEERGKATYLNYGLIWTPTETVNHETAIVKVGDFAKAFKSEGINASSGVILIKKVERWIRENRETILAKRQKQ